MGRQIYIGSRCICGDADDLLYGTKSVQNVVGNPQFQDGLNGDGVNWNRAIEVDSRATVEWLVFVF